jgi:hypothetical protein
MLYFCRTNIAAMSEKPNAEPRDGSAKKSFPPLISEEAARRIFESQPTLTWEQKLLQIRTSLGRPA